MAPESPRILVVEDEAPVRNLLERILHRGGYPDVSFASSGEEACTLLSQSEFALMLTDMRMPGGSGLELLRRSGDQHPGVAAVMVTAVDDLRLADQAMELGAYGYIIKPFKENDVLNGVNSALRRRQLETVSREGHELLEEKVRDRTAALWSALQSVEQQHEDLKDSHENTIERLSIAVELRDDETAAHIRRMSRYCGLLSAWAGLDAQHSELVRKASIMHDVGKVGIPDRILLKTGELTRDEGRSMQQHAEFGHRILSGSTSDLLAVAATIALTHHERFDGTGYPRGLRGDQIPIEGRIASICDVFDAVTTNRVYRRALGLPEAVKIMKQGRGSQFDPELFDLFMAHFDQVLKAKKAEDDRATPRDHASVVPVPLQGDAMPIAI